MKGRGFLHLNGQEIDFKHLLPRQCAMAAKGRRFSRPAQVADSFPRFDVGGPFSALARQLPGDPWTNLHKSRRFHHLHDGEKGFKHLRPSSGAMAAKGRPFSRGAEVADSGPRKCGPGCVLGT